MSDWIIIGSGPSAEKGLRRAVRKSGKDRKFAAVNGSYKLRRDIDAYGVFEWPAFENFKKVILEFIVARKDVYLRPPMRGHLPMKKTPENVKYLSMDYVFNQRSLNKFWMTSAVLMMLAKANENPNGRIFMVGVDGYTVDGDEYSGKVDLCEKRPERDETFCHMSNGCASKWITKITNHFKGCEFVWIGKPNLDLTHARVEVVE